MSDKLINNKYSVLSIWYRFLRERWQVYSLGAISVLLTNLMQVLAPKNIGWIVDFFAHQSIPHYFVGESDRATFLNLFILLISTRVLINVFRFGWRISLGRQTHYACAFLKKEIWDSVRYFSKNDLEYKYSKGILMNIQTSDANSARFIFGFTLVAITDVVFLGFFTFIAISLISLKMALLSFMVLLFVPFLIRNISAKEVTQYKKIQEALSSFNDLASQSVSTLKMQRLTQTAEFWEKRLVFISDLHRIEKLFGINLSLLYVPIMGFASIVSYVVLFAFGIHFTFAGEMSVGDFISIQGLIFLMHDPLMSLGFIVSEWKKGYTALERISEIIQNPKDSMMAHDGRELAIENKIILRVKDLTFCYQNETKPVISQFNLIVNQGDKIGIIGEIGAGKSTLVKILSGLERKIASGEVLFFDKKFEVYSHQDLRSIIGYVPQKPFLFADSVRSNVSLDIDLSDDEIWHFLELASLKEDVLNFPKKLDTQLGEWGINLSGGQKQRLTLARTLARRPRIIFLDDCLSAVDTVTEETILSNLNNYLKETTVVWVAHRQSTLKYCHKIIDISKKEHL